MAGFKANNPGCNCCGCSYPSPLYVTDPVYGVVGTLTGTGGAGSTRQGSYSVSYPGGGPLSCAAATVTVKAILTYASSSALPDTLSVTVLSRTDNNCPGTSTFFQSTKSNTQTPSCTGSTYSATFTLAIGSGIQSIQSLYYPNTSLAFPVTS